MFSHVLRMWFPETGAQHSDVGSFISGETCRARARRPKHVCSGRHPPGQARGTDGATEAPPRPLSLEVAAGDMRPDGTKRPPDS